MISRIHVSPAAVRLVAAYSVDLLAWVRGRIQPGGSAS